MNPWLDTLIALGGLALAYGVYVLLELAAKRRSKDGL